MTTTARYQPSRGTDRTAFRRRSYMRLALWTVQILLALTFLFAGVSKLVMSAGDLTKDTDLPVQFLRFIGVCEVLGAIGLIAPGLLRIHRWLTPLAASGLVIIMVGAVVVTIDAMGIAPALFPLAVGLLAAFVAYGRRRAFEV